MIHRKRFIKFRVVNDDDTNALHEVAFARPAVQFFLKFMILRCLADDVEKKGLSEEESEAKESDDADGLEHSELLETELLSIRVLREPTLLGKKYEVFQHNVKLSPFPWKYTFAVRANVAHPYLEDLNAANKSDVVMGMDVRKRGGESGTRAREYRREQGMSVQAHHDHGSLVRPMHRNPARSIHSSDGSAEGNGIPLALLPYSIAPLPQSAMRVVPPPPMLPPLHGGLSQMFGEPEDGDE